MPDAALQALVTGARGSWMASSSVRWLSCPLLAEALLRDGYRCDTALQPCDRIQHINEISLRCVCVDRIRRVFRAWPCGRPCLIDKTIALQETRRIGS
jgi:hypothetical protein